MKRLALISITALLGACASGGPVGTLDPAILARASCLQQIQLPQDVDLKKLNAEQALEFYAKIEACLDA
jgi:hypothetical protein